MTEQQSIEAAKESLTAYNQKDWDKVRSSITNDCVYDEVATNRRVQGSDQVTETWKAWAESIPDSRASFDNEYASGGKVVLEITWRGKQTGPLQTPDGSVIPPTGKNIELRACQIVDVEDGKVKTVRHYFDLMTMMQQLGVV